jgi:hypothetical protein
MIIFAPALDSDEIPNKPVELCKRIINRKRAALAKQELNNQFETQGLNKVGLLPEYTANIYLGSFLWASRNTPSNHSPFFLCQS